MKSLSRIMPDTTLLIIIFALIVMGLFIFTSASFGLLTRDGATWSDVLFSQIILGLCAGLVLGVVAYFAPINKLRRYSFWVFVFAGLLCLLVFVPGIGFSTGGAARWIHLGSISFQPSEFLKLALVFFLAHWASVSGEARMQSVREGLLPFLLFLGLSGLLIVTEPDTGTFLVMFASSIGIFLIAGGRFLHFFYIILGAILLVGVLAAVRPYVRERIVTYLHPESDQLDSGYQIKQSLLAIGSGQITGRGFGQSVQKFQYLPEPIGDSIFAVLGEEFGFIGTFFVLMLYLSLFLRGLIISSRSGDSFSRLLAAGIVIMITSQAFIHIGALIGLTPLTGVPLPFVSHGGTALMFTLIASGMLLQISRSQKSPKTN